MSTVHHLGPARDVCQTPPSRVAVLSRRRVERLRPPSAPRLAPAARMDSRGRSAVICFKQPRQVGGVDLREIALFDIRRLLQHGVMNQARSGVDLVGVKMSGHEEGAQVGGRASSSPFHFLQTAERLVAQLQTRRQTRCGQSRAPTCLADDSAAADAPIGSECRAGSNSDATPMAEVKVGAIGGIARFSTWELR